MRFKCYSPRCNRGPRHPSAQAPSHNRGATEFFSGRAAVIRECGATPLGPLPPLRSTQVYVTVSRLTPGPSSSIESHQLLKTHQESKRVQRAIIIMDSISWLDIRNSSSSKKKRQPPTCNPQPASSRPALPMLTAFSAHSSSNCRLYAALPLEFFVCS